jgi:hypothetical protein
VIAAGISLQHPGVDCETLPLDKTMGHACRNNALEEWRRMSLSRKCSSRLMENVE